MIDYNLIKDRLKLCDVGKCFFMSLSHWHDCTSEMGIVYGVPTCLGLTFTSVIIMFESICTGGQDLFSYI